MTTVITAYLEFVHSAAGGTIVIGLSLAVCVAVVLWARRGERWAVLLAAGVLTALVAVIYAVAVAAGWWGGAYFRAPVIVQAATLVALSFTGWVAWLLGYGWLAGRSRYPLLVYAAVALLAVAATILADRANVSGGLVLVADDGKTWIDALIGTGIMLVPVILFEVIQRALARDALP